jgi:hypothetical protein
LLRIYLSFRRENEAFDAAPPVPVEAGRAGEAG